jgi:hypothetical protein
MLLGLAVANLLAAVAMLPHAKVYVVVATDKAPGSGPNMLMPPTLLQCAPTAVVPEPSQPPPEVFFTSQQSTLANGRWIFGPHITYGVEVTLLVRQT